jgi:hypothetical protein
VTKKELIPMASRVSAANKTELGMLGGLLIKVTMTDSKGHTSETLQLCYISNPVHTLYLWRGSMEGRR